MKQKKGQVNVLRNKVRFILAVLSEELVVHNRKKAELLAQLVLHFTRTNGTDVPMHRARAAAAPGAAAAAPPAAATGAPAGAPDATPAAVSAFLATLPGVTLVQGSVTSSSDCATFSRADSRARCAVLASMGCPSSSCRNLVCR